MATWHLHIRGQVQGVGFRPYVYRQARQSGLTGWVRNDTDGVHIEINADREEAEAFVARVIESAPALARITDYRCHEVAARSYVDFRIQNSRGTAAPELLLTPDLALCEPCRRELMQAGNRRRGYPFITCTYCGPRYSIVRALPYDRQRTSMDYLTMCAACAAEYADPNDRRYHAQTNSCPDCAVAMQLWAGTQRVAIRDAGEMVDRIVRAWSSGQIVALKGIGGYLLTCAADQEATIQRLRERKHRPAKPLALMVPTLAAVRDDLELGEAEIATLHSPAAPIVLAPLKVAAGRLPWAHAAIAPGLDRVGIMLPYTPLYELLLHGYGRPIVATSGNLTNAPIAYADDRVFAELGSLADLILTNDRPIVLPQDDSVVQYSTFRRQRITLRRARGLAPAYLDPALRFSVQGPILAMGADLKSTFAVLDRSQVVISQYLGDLSNFDTLQNYQYTLDRLLALYQLRPVRVIVDLHPDYVATRTGQARAANSEAEVFSVQHHLAHFAAVLGENDLLHGPEPVLGVIWDGAGLGADGHIWGGEFFRYERYDFIRCAHLDYFPHLLGDKLAREPRLAAYCATQGIAGAERLLKDRFTATEWSLYTRLLHRDNHLQTSSVGRLFDAVAALLGLADRQSYEGEAALQLETLATRYFRRHGLAARPARKSRKRLTLISVLTVIIAELARGQQKESIAARFHLLLVEWIAQIAREQAINKIAFSGGVFQNGLLVDLLLAELGAEFELYFHRQLSPNDENISFGQLVYHQIANWKKTGHHEVPNRVSRP